MLPPTIRGPVGQRGVFNRRCCGHPDPAAALRPVTVLNGPVHLPPVVTPLVDTSDCGLR
jgi:hypothetical protein